MVNHYSALTCMIHYRLLPLCEQTLKWVHKHLTLRTLVAWDPVTAFKLFSHYILVAWVMTTCLIPLNFVSWDRVRRMWHEKHSFLIFSTTNVVTCFLFLKMCIYLINIFDSTGSLLLLCGLSLFQRVGATIHCGVWASLCSGFSCEA